MRYGVFFSCVAFTVPYSYLSIYKFKAMDWFYTYGSIIARKIYGVYNLLKLSDGYAYTMGKKFQGGTHE